MRLVVMLACWTALVSPCWGATSLPDSPLSWELPRVDLFETENFVAGQQLAQTLQLAPGGAIQFSGATPVPMAVPGQPAPPATPGQPADAEKKEGKDGGDKKEAPAEPKTIERPLAPENPGDPKELAARPTQEGTIHFSFSGQKWPAVLEWLATVSHLSLDWQELPADHLNLRLNRDYTIAEAQDLINRHLLARGFTMLISGETLSVANISKLNPALVPRVEPAGLISMPDNSFVKVSFPLRSILAERAVEELKPMLSPNGKLSALKGVNRLEAMDAAGNLRDIYKMLEQEQSTESEESTVIEVFRLKHRRATEVVVLLEGILGLDKPAGQAKRGASSGGDMMSAQVLQQMQQMQQMLQQQQQNKGGAPGPAGANDPKLVVNDRENSILAHAPADKMEIIRSTVRAVDVPGDSAGNLLQSINKVKPYRLSTLEPQPLIDILQELGELSPQARIQSDEKNRAVIVFGSLADHYMIAQLIQRLDGSNRSFEVIQLRRVRADQVAGTIQYMMGAEEEDKNKSSSRYSYFNYYGSVTSNRNDAAESRPFKVDADVDNNRLLLWADEVELQEVKQLLVKMGEVSLGSSNTETLRTFELDSDEAAEELLKRIQEFWPEIEPNQLQIAPSREKTPQAKPAPAPAPSPTAAIDAGVPARRPHPVNPLLRLAMQEHEVHPLNSSGSDQAASESGSISAGEEFSPSPQPRPTPPITIQRGPNGQILIGSQDTDALNKLEDLMRELAPPPKDYHVFQLKYPTTWAYGIELTLKDMFKKEDDEQTVFDPYWGTTYNAKVNRGNRMSRKKPLKIISDEDSHTILVQGATPEELRTMEDLIAVYDRPTSSDPQTVRKTAAFQLKYSQAKAVGETIKQVYRDLLSSNDPALQNANNNQKTTTTERIYSYGGYGNQGSGANKSDAPQQPLRFKGLLSVGIDEVSNSVVVSAGEDLLENVRELVEHLDEAANPKTSVQVMHVRNVQSSMLKERLDKVFGPDLKSSSNGDRKNGNGGQHPLNGQPVVPGQNGTVISTE